jgi:hypothetical protein
VATAVYVVVAEGLTDCVPPVPDRVYELPSLPVMVTAVALTAETVSVALLPGAMAAGVAVMLMFPLGVPTGAPLEHPTLKRHRATQRSDAARTSELFGKLERKCERIQTEDKIPRKVEPPPGKDRN